MKTKELFKPDRRNQVLNITEEYLTGYVFGIELSHKVPARIAVAVEMTRKIILYAYYDYGFYTLSAAHLYLTAESAVKDRLFDELPDSCALTKDGKTDMVPKEYQTIFQRLREEWQIIGFEHIGHSLKSIICWFKEQGILPSRIGDREIELLNQLRMYAIDIVRSDPMSPGVLIPLYWKIIDFINCLYDKSAHPKEPEMLKELRERYAMLSKAVENIKKSKKSR